MCNFITKINVFKIIDNLFLFVEFNKRFIIVVLYLDTSTSHGVESVILSYRWFKINFKLTFYMLIKLFVNYL